MPDNRIGWDDFFFNIALVARLRSHDLHTKHGAVIIDKEHNRVSLGYNGFVKHFPDDVLPKTRPEKYDYIVHAELNAILNAKRDLTGCTIYITGFPCLTCLNAILQSGITKLNIMDIKSHCLPDSYMGLFDDIIDKSMASVEIFGSKALKSRLREYCEQLWD